MSQHLNQNKKLWDNWTTGHFTSDFYDVQGFLKHRNSLTEQELEHMPDLNGKRVLHLQCHFGQDTLSLATLGARVCGLDLSTVAIEKARELATKMEVNAEFIEHDASQPFAPWAAQFDVVFASFGVIGWHPSASRWMDAAFSYLKPGGKLVFLEFHPAIWMLDDDFDQLKYPYLNGDPIVTLEEDSYAAAGAEPTTCTTWNHGVSDVLAPILNHPERELITFKEYDYSPHAFFKNHTEIAPKRYQFKGREGIMPMTYAVVARKK